MALTKDQAAHSKERIVRKYHDAIYQEGGETPAKVVAAKKIVEEWNATRAAKSEEVKRKLRRERDVAEQIALAGDFKAAVAAVERFEKLKF